MSDWIPSLGQKRGPIYLSIVKKLEADITSGIVTPGTRLLPLREMADRLKVSVGTISKAYTRAESNGLISVEVGRGTFVNERNQTISNLRQTSPISKNLALNVPPATGEKKLISETLKAIADDQSMGDLLSYLPHQGSRKHRDSICQWLSSQNMASDVGHIMITPGAQHAIDIAMRTVAKPGSTILTESMTYSGMMALAVQSSYRLNGIQMDDKGIIPEALDKAFAETDARVLYCTPTIQTPTGVVMPEDRRREIATIIKRHDAFIIEDDAYAFLPEHALRPISAEIPERSFYIISFAKCLAPGLRIGAMVIPPRFRDACANAMRVTGWMAPPIMAEIVCRLIDNKELAEQVRRKRLQANERDTIARRVLEGWLPPKNKYPGFHVWLPLPTSRSPAALVSQASLAGITLSSPDTLNPLDPAHSGIRLCLGSIEQLVRLESTLVEVKSILEGSDSISVV